LKLLLLLIWFFNFFSKKKRIFARGASPLSPNDIRVVGGKVKGLYLYKKHIIKYNHKLKLKIKLKIYN